MSGTYEQAVVAVSCKATITSSHNQYEDQTRLMSMSYSGHRSANAISRRIFELTGWLAPL